MPEDLKPYPTYKDSGVPWLGQVPEHWRTERLKTLMSNVIQQVTERQDADLYVALEHVESWTGRLKLASSDSPFDSQVKCFGPGDVLFGKLRPYLAKVTRPTRAGVCVGEFLVLRPRISSVTAPYMEQLLRSKPIIEEVNRSTFGAKMPRADWQFVGGMLVVLPPTPEQAAIVRYLDHTDRKVRRGIHARQQLIKLLTEQKQAIIQRAVTRGLDPDVRLKPSGVPWLGDVPEHWEIRKVKYVLQTDGYRAGPFGSTLITSQLNPSGTIGVLSPEHVARASMSLDIDLFLPETREREMSQFLVKGRDILFPIVGTLGRAMVVPRDVGKAIINQRLARLRPDETRVNSDYLALLMSKVTLYQELDRVECKGSILDHITKERILERPLPLPPLGEQRAILQFVNAATASLDKAIYAARREIDLLRQYHTRLIADVVTGKLDVCEAAACLPDEQEEQPEPLDEEPVAEASDLDVEESDGDHSEDESRDA